MGRYVCLAILDDDNDEANEFQTAGEFRIHRANFFARSRTGEDIMMDDNIPT